MKIYHFLFYSILLISPSCQNRQNEYNQPQIQLPDLRLEETTTGDKSDTINISRLPKLSQQEYDSLQIKDIEDFIGYDSQDLTMGQVLIDNEEGKVISIHIITEGELTEFLLSYDRHGNLKDKLLVAYEDLVENYSQISSTIKSGIITVQTINYIYDETDSLATETADTIFTTYEISSQLEFVSN